MTGRNIMNGARLRGRRPTASRGGHPIRHATKQANKLNLAKLSKFGGARLAFPPFKNPQPEAFSLGVGGASKKAKPPYEVDPAPWNSAWRGSKGRCNIQAELRGQDLPRSIREGSSRPNSTVLAGRMLATQDPSQLSLAALSASLEATRHQSTPTPGRPWMADRAATRAENYGSLRRPIQAAHRGLEADVAAGPPGPEETPRLYAWRRGGTLQGRSQHLACLRPLAIIILPRPADDDRRTRRPPSLLSIGTELGKLLASERGVGRLGDAESPGGGRRVLYVAQLPEPRRDPFRSRFEHANRRAQVFSVDYVLDSGPLEYLLFWNQQQMHHPQSMQQTPPYR